MIGNDGMAEQKKNNYKCKKAQSDGSVLQILFSFLIGFKLFSLSLLLAKGFIKRQVFDLLYFIFSLLNILSLPATANL